METLPAIRNIDDLNRYADIMVKSGFFSDVRSAAQACVKIMAGQELGIPPIASMRGIYIVKGQISMSSQTMASLIKRSGRYNYKVTESTSQQCRIEFFENGEPCGVSAYSIEDAQRAKLSSSDTWQKYPQMMLFNRAMSNGAKMFCADIFHGSSYVDGELEDNLAGEGSRDTPNMSSSLPSAAVNIVAPTDDMLDELCIHLNRLGVRDGDERRLVEFVNGRKPLTSDECEEVIYSGDYKLPGKWFGSYVTLLLERNPHRDKGSLGDYWRANFGNAKTGGLTHDQQRQVLDWVTATGEPSDDARAPDDETHGTFVVELPKLAPSPWLAEMTRIQNETTASLEVIEAWLLSKFGNGRYSAVEDMPVEWIEAIHQMSGADLKASMDTVPML